MCNRLEILTDIINGGIRDYDGMLEILLDGKSIIESYSIDEDCLIMVDEDNEKVVFSLVEFLHKVGNTQEYDEGRFTFNWYNR